MITLIMLFEKDIYYGKKIHNVQKNFVRKIEIDFLRMFEHSSR